MHFSFLLLILGCFQHVFAQEALLSWITKHESVRLLNANKVKNSFPKGSPVLHDDTDYTLVDDSSPLFSFSVTRNAEDNPSSNLNQTISTAAWSMIYGLFITPPSGVTLTGELENVSEDSRYSYYSLHSSCGDRIPIEQHFEEYLGDESNQVNIWVINEMTESMNVTFTTENEESSSKVNVNTRESSSSLTSTLGVSAFGQSASVSVGMEFGSGETFKRTNAVTEKKSATYNLPVKSQKAIKFMRYMKMQKLKNRFEVHCNLQGYIGLQLSFPLNGQYRWFMPVTELAKYYNGFVLDDSKPNAVIFKFPGYEVSSGSIHIQRTLGFDVKDLGQEFLAL